MSELKLKPGNATLADWREIYRGAVPKLDAACRPKIKASAEAVARIVANGEPVYGINTGFGKLASVRIPAADLETLQRNIVLSHAAGLGEPMPVAVCRLMMALKLASLAQGASGVRPQTIELLEAMLANDVIPVVPAQGSVGASGDLAPLSHMTAVMIGVGESFTPHGRVPATARSFRPPMRWPPCSTPKCFISRRWSPARFRPMPPRVPTPPSIRASICSGSILDRSRRLRHCATLWPAAPSVNRTGSATSACRTRTACAASRR
jgi:hypothetical protein